MEKTQLQELTEKVGLVMENYRKDYPEVKMKEDYFPLKITEEWGECLQTYLMLSDQGRQKGKTKEEIKDHFSEEIADVFGYLLAFAQSQEIDLAEALEKKWFQYLKQST
jgi:NTP pyrophosphatase (non-canonical NTP hydrolase)